MQPTNVRELGTVILAHVVAFAGICACRCNATVPTPRPVTVIIGDADIPLPVGVCANLQAFCPGSMPDGGLAVCASVVQARYGLTPATMPTVLMCEALALDKASFFACGGVGVCP